MPLQGKKTPGSSYLRYHSIRLSMARSSCAVSLLERQLIAHHALVKDDQGLKIRHQVNCCQSLFQETFVILEASGNHVQHVIVCAGDNAALGHFRQIAQSGVKSITIFFGVLVEFDKYHGSDLKTEHFVVEHRPVMADPAFLLQFAQAPQTGRGGEIDLLRQLCITYSGVALQQSQNFAIYVV